MLRRLANFCHLFPGCTPMNIPDMEYRAWRGMAEACDQYVADMNASNTKARR